MFNARRVADPECPVVWGVILVLRSTTCAANALIVAHDVELVDRTIVLVMLHDAVKNNELQTLEHYLESFPFVYAVAMRVYTSAATL